MMRTRRPAQGKRIICSSIRRVDSIPVLSQVENFHQAIPLTGLCVTKLDGTAKGGVVIAVAERYGIPIRYIGVGEGLEDLREFVPVDFVNALIPERDGSR